MNIYERLTFLKERSYINGYGLYPLKQTAGECLLTFPVRVIFLLLVPLITTSLCPSCPDSPLLYLQHPTYFSRFSNVDIFTAIRRLLRLPLSITHPFACLFCFCFPCPCPPDLSLNRLLSVTTVLTLRSEPNGPLLSF